MAEYDLLSGGLTDLKKDIQDYINKLEDSVGTITDKTLKEIEQEIKTNGANTITNEEMRLAVANQTFIERTGLGRGSVKNDSQAATYSEFGTGLVGSMNPTADARMGWKYMMNPNRDYRKGWRYKDPLSGRLVKTMGVGSNNVFYRAAQIGRENIKIIASNELKKGRD